MKNTYALVAFFCLISSVACSMEKTFDGIKISLDAASKEQLLKLSVESVNKGKPGYWPADAKITLAGFYLLQDEYQHTDNPRYAVRLEAHYERLAVNNGFSNFLTICHPTTGAYRKHELDALGFSVPDNK